MTSSIPAAAVAATAAPSARPLSAAELADRQTPASPTVSPDGRNVAYVVSPSSQQGEKAAHAIWVAGPDAAPRQLTAGTHADGSPRWSP
ncbi:MAG: PD40 domain-containing protein, partial [Thermomicrobiales bacterium]|nr:PD40 domain-containing protein [Thermomicrobiales bacterium]